MRVILPFFGSRVSPNILFSDQVLLVQTYKEDTVSRRILSTGGFTEADWIKLIDNYEVNTVVCGGIDNLFSKELTGRNVRVINNVAGEIEEVLEHLKHNRLRPGYGISYHIDNSHSFPHSDHNVSNSNPFEEESELLDHTDKKVNIDCTSCVQKECLEGKSCHQCPLEAIVDHNGNGSKKMLEVAIDISSEPERVLCRVSELVYFCLGMQYKHIGIAFCTEMWKEAEHITHILKRFFDITSVCCKVGSVYGDENTNATGNRHTTCNPVGMANTLNLADRKVKRLLRRFL